MSCAIRLASSGEVAKPCGDVGMPALATIFLDSYSKNLIRCGSLSWPGMRLVTLLIAGLLLFPATAAAADVSISLKPGAGVQYGTGHGVQGRLADGTAPVAGQPVELRGREYPYDAGFTTLATAVTDASGAYGFERTFDRNMQLQVVAPGQGAFSKVVRAYVYPRPNSRFKALEGGRLRITQYLRAPANVRLSAKTIFYLGPKGAKTAPQVARAKPKPIGKGRFKATATVRLPSSWAGSFRYGSCFRYSEGSGLGNPGSRCPKKYRFG
jgi:hypothetical protein